MIIPVALCNLDHARGANGANPVRGITPQIAEESTATHSSADCVTKQEAKGGVDQKPDTQLCCDLRTRLSQLRFGYLRIAIMAHGPVAQNLVQASAEDADRKEPEVPSEN